MAYSAAICVKSLSDRFIYYIMELNIDTGGCLYQEYRNIFKTRGES